MQTDMQLNAYITPQTSSKGNGVDGGNYDRVITCNS